MRDTYMTISIVVASRSWDFFFTDHLLPLVLGETQNSVLLECVHSTTYFLALLPIGAVLLAFTATPRVARRWRSAEGSSTCGVGYRSAYMKLCVPAVGMAVGWSFSSVVTSCDKEIDVLKAHALSSGARQWSHLVSWWAQVRSNEASPSAPWTANVASNGSATSEPLWSSARE